MFVPEADMSCLRQGDILKEIPFPLLSTQDLLVLGSVAEHQGQSQRRSLVAVTRVHRQDPDWVTAQIPIRFCYCAVLSQCCDLAPRHDKIRMPTISLARLIPVPARILNDPEALASLRGNKDPRNVADPGFINLFYVPAHEYLDATEWVVDYNQTVSIPSQEFPGILRKKVLQMEDRSRVKFKIKLGASCTRLTDEERDGGLENPWGPA